MTSPQDVKAWVKSAFWSWFDANQDDELMVIKIWIIKKTIRLRDLRFVFEKFFGSYINPAVRAPFVINNPGL